MDEDLRKRLNEVGELLSQPLEETHAGADPDVSSNVIDNAKKATDKVTSLIDKIKDNIAYVLGLPAAVSGAFGFLWQSSGDEAALDYKVQQLETAVAELKSENDLLASANDEVLLLHMYGPFTYGSAKGMIQMLSGSGEGYKSVVFDFSEVPLIDGSIAMAFEELLRQALETDQNVVISGLGGPAVEILDRMGVLDTIPAEHRVSDRIAALKLAIAKTKPATERSKH